MNDESEESSDDNKPTAKTLVVETVSFKSSVCLTASFTETYVS